MCQILTKIMVLWACFCTTQAWAQGPAHLQTPQLANLTLQLETGVSLGGIGSAGTLEFQKDLDSIWGWNAQLGYEVGILPVFILIPLQTTETLMASVGLQTHNYGEYMGVELSGGLGVAQIQRSYDPNSCLSKSFDCSIPSTSQTQPFVRMNPKLVLFPVSKLSVVGGLDLRMVSMGSEGTGVSIMFGAGLRSHF